MKTSKVSGTILSVTNFLYCGDDYLFLRRNKDKKIDPGKVNGIGGKLEGDEDYVAAAIRETLEETGYEVKEKDLQFCGFIKFAEGFEHQWLTCFFKVEVLSKAIPIGEKTKDGELFWIHKDKVLGSEYDFVDDIHYCFDDILKSEKLFFMTVRQNEKGKICKANKTSIPI